MVAAWTATVTMAAISIFPVMGPTAAPGGGGGAPHPPAAPGNTGTPVPDPGPLMRGPGPPVPPPPLSPFSKAECVRTCVMGVGVSEAWDGAPPRSRKESTRCPGRSQPGMREPMSVWLGSSHEILVFAGGFGAKIWIGSSPPFLLWDSFL